MDTNTSFKNRVLKQIVTSALVYKNTFIDHEYLIYSLNFSLNPYYLISAHADNYLHLTGVYTTLSANEFFNKALNGTLTENDFEISRPNHPISISKNNKGTIRKKINALPYIDTLFNTDTLVQEAFHKNQISCSFATSDNNITMGFIHTATNARPKTLLKGNELDLSKSSPLDLVLKRKLGNSLFDKVIIGDINCISNELILSQIDSSISSLPFHSNLHIHKTSQYSL